MRITPACAGSTCHYTRFENHHYGSPPLARGVRKTESEELTWIRITPACAGSTIVVWGFDTDNEDHPRLRGEY